MCIWLLCFFQIIVVSRTFPYKGFKILKIFGQIKNILVFALITLLKVAKSQ